MCVLALVFFLACNESTIEGNHLARLGFYADGDAIIAELSPKKKTCYDYFLLGQAYRDRKQYKDAIFNFANSCFLYHQRGKLTLYPSPVYDFISGFHVKSPLYDEAVYEIADLFMKYREYAYVVKFADRVSDEMPGLHFDARILKAQAMADSGNFDGSMKELQSLHRDYKDASSRQIAGIKTGSILEKLEKFGAAVDRYSSVIGLEEKSWQAQLAARRIAYIQETRNIVVAPDKLPCAGRALYHGGEYERAAAMLARADFPEKNARERDGYLVRCLVRLNKPVDAVAAKYAGDPEARAELASIRADEMWDSGRQYAAVPVYREIIESGLEPWSQKAHARTALYLGDRRAGDSGRYMISYKDKYSDETAESCLWLLGKNSLRAGDSAAAARYFGESIERFPAGASADRCRFWLYKIAVKDGDTAKSGALFRDMIVKHPDSSYAWQLIQSNRDALNAEDLAREYSRSTAPADSDARIFCHSMLYILDQNGDERVRRLQAMPEAAAPYTALEKKIAGPELESAYSGVLQGLEKYFAVGDMKAINRELRLINADKKASVDSSAALAHFARKYGHHGLAVTSAQDLLKAHGLRENIFLSPESFSRDLYPRGFSECLENSSTDIDPNYVFAVIKAESSFNHAAVSPAGAVGLMQLMPATAGDVAKKLEVADYSLKDPCTSVRFGSYYLSWLMRFFNGNIVFAVGGYNAGAGNVIKWRREMPADDADFFIEFVPFDETRGYMLRTAKFYQHYVLLYGKDRGVRANP